MPATLERIALGEAKVFTMRELSQHTARVINEINHQKTPALLTRHGRFLAIIYPVANQAIETIALKHIDELLGVTNLSDETESTLASSDEVALELNLSQD